MEERERTEKLEARVAELEKEVVALRKVSDGHLSPERWQEISNECAKELLEDWQRNKPLNGPQRRQTSQPHRAAG